MAKSESYPLLATDSVPASSALTGTISIVGGSKFVTATGGAFLSEVQSGDGIYDVTNGEIQIVDRVYNNNKLSVLEAFTTNSSSVKSIVRPRMNWLSVVASVGADATVDGELIPEAIAVTFGSQDPTQVLKPKVVDIGTSTVFVNYETV